MHRAADRDPRKPLRFLYNPFEFAVCDPGGLFGDALAEALAVELGKTHRVGVVTDADAAGREDDGVARLVHTPGRSLLAVPRGHYGDSIIQPLLELDLVIVRDDAEGPGPFVLVMGDGPPPAGTPAVAYVAESSACPILPPGAPFFTRDDVAGLARHVVRHLTLLGRDVPLYGLVMAGGSSTRMERDKAGLTYRGKPQAQRCHDLLETSCAAVFVSARGEQQDDPALHGLPLITDAFAGFGPMGGILSALKAYPGAAWCVLACDLPLVDRETIEELIAHRAPMKVATAFESGNGLPEPLCTLYEPKSVFPLHRAMAHGAYSLHRVLADASGALLQAANREALTNVNTQKEHDWVLARIEAEGR